MATTETTTAHTAYAQLNNGTDTEGNIKTVNVSIGSLSASDWNAQKAMNIILAMEGCLTKTVYSAIHKRSSILQTSGTMETSSASNATSIPTTLLRKQS